jgi:hypothetical protein
MTLNNDLPLRCTHGNHPLSGKYNHYVWDDGTCMVAGTEELTAEQLAELKVQMDHDFATIRWADEHPGEPYPHLGPDPMRDLEAHILADEITERWRRERGDT